jgi:hypothetical protein
MLQGVEKQHIIHSLDVYIEPLRMLLKHSLSFLNHNLIT